jgi:hypothetical protein
MCASCLLNACYVTAITSMVLLSAALSAHGSAAVLVDEAATLGVA